MSDQNEVKLHETIDIDKLENLAEHARRESEEVIADTMTIEEMIRMVS